MRQEKYRPNIADRIANRGRRIRTELAIGPDMLTNSYSSPQDSNLNLLQQIMARAALKMELSGKYAANKTLEKKTQAALATTNTPRRNRLKRQEQNWTLLMGQYLDKLNRITTFLGRGDNNLNG